MPDIPFTDSSDDHTLADLANFASLSLYLGALYNPLVTIFFSPFFFSKKEVALCERTSFLA